MTSHGISLRLDESSKWPYHDVGVHCNKEQRSVFIHPPNHHHSAIVRRRMAGAMGVSGSTYT